MHFTILSMNLKSIPFDNKCQNFMILLINNIKSTNNLIYSIQNVIILLLTFLII